MYVLFVGKHSVYSKFTYYFRRTVLNIYFLFLIYINYIIYNMGFNMKYKRRKRAMGTVIMDSIKVLLAISPVFMVYSINEFILN